MTLDHLLSQAYGGIRGRWTLVLADWMSACVFKHPYDHRDFPVRTA